MNGTSKIAAEAATARRTVDSVPGPGQIVLVFQGGGALGAFTWGVLDRLLEDSRIEIEGVSASSSGALWRNSMRVSGAAAPSSIWAFTSIMPVPEC